MNRRAFLKHISLAMAMGLALNRLPWPRTAEASTPNLRLALLADAHLKNGDPARPEAQALARAVAEIRAMKPTPDLLLFAGDLAHDGSPHALALGQEILSDFPAPIFAVRGEGDGPVDGSAWNRLFGKAPFVYSCQGVSIMGIDTAVRSIESQSPSYFTFTLGPAQCRWLAQELRRLDPDAPLILLSHAPLTPIFQPWQQWIADAHRLAPLLARFGNVLCLHGHVHQTDFRFQVSGFRNEWPVVGGQRQEERSAVSGRWSVIRKFVKLLSTCSFMTQNLKPKTHNLALPATAWPLPSPLQGTPRRFTPGLAPHGCGWSLIALNHAAWDFRPRIWQA